MANKNKGTYEREEENQKRVEIQIEHFKKGIVKSVKCGTQAKGRTKRVYSVCERLVEKVQEEMSGGQINRRQDTSSSKGFERSQ